jgi:hypothetical protein
MHVKIRSREESAQTSRSYGENGVLTEKRSREARRWLA